MSKVEKYQGIIPAFYACYEEDGKVSKQRTRELARHMADKGVKGLYVCGSSGECIYLSKKERKKILEIVMDEVGGELTVIAHVACNNTEDSEKLAAHAESLGVDAIAAIPPIYFHLPDHAVAQYWNDISAAAPNTDFIIYNIPQLSGTRLTLPLYRKMLENPRVIGVKNSSEATQDIQMFKDAGGEGHVVMNGPDEQLVSGLAIGADGGIGGTYGVMPELYLAIYDAVKRGDIPKAQQIQNEACRIIYALCGCHGNMYAVIKKVMDLREGLSLGGVRKPLANLVEADMPKVQECVQMIDKAVTLC
ncbi:MAG: N-acetylneuraminate lyase [Lachnospiraceae bacterium]|jgi:N-acetylneuraminate lyase|nr:N-acetylneuraminate lyase [Lachnospiraceae bacterium]